VAPIGDGGGQGFSRYRSGDPLDRLLGHRALGERSQGARGWACHDTISGRGADRAAGLAELDGEPDPAARKDDAPVTDRVLSFVRFELIDDEGRPAPGVQFSVRLPDGEVRRCTTDSSGRVEINGIDPGTCTIETDLRGAQLRDTWAVSETQTGRPAGSAGSATARRTRLARLDAHKVATGESLASIAAAHGTSWQELSYFNFGTSDPNEINARLPDDVGCTRTTASGKNYIFDTADDPGILYLPSAWTRSGFETGATHPIRVHGCSLGSQLFRGRLLWMDRVPIVDTEIVLRGPDGAERERGKTDAKGWFRFPGEHPSDCTVECLWVPEADERVLFARIVRADRTTPVANATVSYTEFGSAHSAETDDGGVLRVEALTDAFYWVVIEGESIEIPTYPASALAADTAPDDVVLGRMPLAWHEGPDQDLSHQDDSFLEEGALDAIEFEEMDDTHEGTA